MGGGGVGGPRLAFGEGALDLLECAGAGQEGRVTLNSDNFIEHLLCA